MIVSGAFSAAFGSHLAFHGGDKVRGGRRRPPPPSPARAFARRDETFGTPRSERPSLAACPQTPSCGARGAVAGCCSEWSKAVARGLLLGMVESRPVVITRASRSSRPAVLARVALLRSSLEGAARARRAQVPRARRPARARRDAPSRRGRRCCGATATTTPPSPAERRGEGRARRVSNAQQQGIARRLYNALLSNNSKEQRSAARIALLHQRTTPGSLAAGTSHNSRDRPPPFLAAGTPQDSEADPTRPPIRPQAVNDLLTQMDAGDGSKGDGRVSRQEFAE